MPLNETDKAWVREYFKTTQERLGWGKLTGAIKDWGGAGAAAAILILAVTQWTAYVEFRTQTNDRLGIVEKKLTTSELQSQVSLPQADFDKALPDIRSTVAAARKDRISVPPAVIEGLRSKLLASNSAAPDFWPTLSEFVSYRSALSYHAAAATPTPPTSVYSFAKLVPDCTDSLPKPMTVKEVLSPNEITQNRGLYENCRFVLDSVKQDQVLNTILRGNTPLITFKNCLIEYRGGEINLILAWDKEPFTWTLVGRGPQDPSKILHMTVSAPAVQFENCLFVFEFQNSPPPNGQRLSTTLLAESATSVSLPVSP
jgi:hypothetical protein